MSVEDSTDKSRRTRRPKRKGFAAVYPEMAPLLVEWLEAHGAKPKEVEDSLALFVLLLPLAHSDTGEVRGADSALAWRVGWERKRFGRITKRLAAVGLLERIAVARNAKHKDLVGWRFPLPVYEWATGERRRMPLFADLFRHAERYSFDIDPKEGAGVESTQGHSATWVKSTQCLGQIDPSTGVESTQVHRVSPAETVPLEVVEEGEEEEPQGGADSGDSHNDPETLARGLVVELGADDPSSGWTAADFAWLVARIAYLPSPDRVWVVPRVAQDPLPPRVENWCGLLRFRFDRVQAGKPARGRRISIGGAAEPPGSFGPEGLGRW